MPITAGLPPEQHPGDLSTTESPAPPEQPSRDLTTSGPPPYADVHQGARGAGGSDKGGGVTAPITLRIAVGLAEAGADVAHLHVGRFVAAGVRPATGLARTARISD